MRALEKTSTNAGCAHPWEELVVRAAAGDEGSLADLYAASRWMVFGLALSIVGDASEADEVVLDVYLQVWEQALRFDPRRGTAKAWLKTMTRSRAIDRTRRTARRSQFEVNGHTLLDVPAGTRTPEAEMLLGQTGDWLRAALGHLCKEQREVIELAFVAGLTHGELAAKLRLPLGTIKSRIRLGLSKLRELLKDVA